MCSIQVYILFLSTILYKSVYSEMGSKLWLWIGGSGYLYVLSELVSRVDLQLETKYKLKNDFYWYQLTLCSLNSR